MEGTASGEAAPKERTEHSFFGSRPDSEPARPTGGLACDRIVGGFRLVRLLGQGGMGQVWEAEQISLGGRRVAVKFVWPDRVTARELELFQREARAGGRLSHPGIVALHSYGESDGLAWIAMELVEGAWTLRDFLDATVRVEELPESYDRDVARLAAEIAEAMAAAHAAGVIHRDLKPQNILVTPQDHAKVTDFGLARILDESALSQTGEIAGTYFYMSPEQVAARRAGIDHRTDVFSLGIVLYELLTLRRPFQGDTGHQVAEQILAKDPPDPRAIRSRTPRDLVVIAQKALEKDRDKRFQTMDELAADLRRFLASEPIRARPPTLLDRTVKWTHRHPAMSLAAGIAAGALAVISTLLVANVRANERLQRTIVDLDTANHALSIAVARERERTQEVLRFSSLQDCDELVAEADELWPPHPELVDRYRSWIGLASRLVAELPGHYAKRDEQRSFALPRTEEERVREREAHPEFRRLAELDAELARLLAGTDARGPDAGAVEAHALATAERGALLARLDERREWRFDEAHTQEREWNEQLGKLIERLETLRNQGTGLLAEGEDAASPAHGWSVPRRLAFAEQLRQDSLPGGEWAARWEAALGPIATCDLYGGLDLVPQTGLVPIGPDPDSGLWEFWHVASGAEPRRDPGTERLVRTELMGIVLVLLPAGKCRMGAQHADISQDHFDTDACPDEGPVHEVRLSAHFLSKYELTQAQWMRIAGINPSGLQPSHVAVGSLLHPVEQVSWLDCATWLERAGLSLPTEAQWEYACRANTDTPWWTSDDPASLGELGVANLSLRRARGSSAEGSVQPDVFVFHAPVGTFAANGFGLHDVHGNVSEWCRDAYHEDSYAQSPAEDPLFEGDEDALRVHRGGNFLTPAELARSSRRDRTQAPIEDFSIGVRPARALTR